MNKNEIKVLDEETSITLRTVNDLTRLANEAISAYNATHPMYNKLTERILKTLTDETVFDSLDNEELFKLIAITSKNQLAPIEQLTKLVAQLNALQERMDAAKEIEKLRAIVEEMKSAQEQDRAANTIEAEASYINYEDGEDGGSEQEESEEPTLEPGGGELEAIPIVEESKKNGTVTIQDLLKKKKAS